MPTPEKPTTLSPAYSFVGAEVSPNEYKGVNPPCIHITPMEQTALFAHSPALASLTPCRQYNGVIRGNKGKVFKGASLYEYPLLERVTQLCSSEWGERCVVGMCKQRCA